MVENEGNLVIVPLRGIDELPRESIPSNLMELDQRDAEGARKQKMELSLSNALSAEAAYVEHPCRSQ